MKKHLLIIMVCVTINSPAQQATFSKVYYDVPQFGIEEHAIVQVYNNGYIMVGKENFYHGYILRVDSSGNFLWNKTYSDNISLVFNAIAATDDSCFVIAGDVYNSATSQNDLFYAKIDSTGDTLWVKTIGIAGYSLSALSVKQTNDSGYIMTGSASHNVAPYSRIFAAKINPSGTLQWINLITGGNYQNTGNSVKQASDSSYYITGYMENYPPYEGSAFLMKLSQPGSVLWTKKYFLPASQTCSGNDFEFTNDGMVCYLNGGGYNVLMKTDTSGNILWNKSYSNSFAFGSPYVSIPKVHLTSDSGFVFISGSCSFDDAITKTDSAGNIEWIDNLMLIPMDVIETGNKELFISGNGPLCGVLSPQVLSPQIGIIQTDSIGNNPNCVYSMNITPAILPLSSAAVLVTSLSGGVTGIAQPVIGSLMLISDSGCVDISGGINENKFNNDIEIFPNPSSGIFTVTSLKRKQAVIIITTVLGKEIYKADMGDGKVTIDLSPYAKGIYFCNIESKNEKFETVHLPDVQGKIVIIE